MLIKILYTIFLGILVALFVGFGIEAFYPSPKYPEYPRALETAPLVVSPDAPRLANGPAETEEQKKLREEYQKQSDEYSKIINPRYNRNVSLMTIVAAVIILIVSLTFLHKIQLLSDGLLLGGILVLLYSIIRALMGQDQRYSFIVITVGLIIAFALGYLKFIRPEASKKS